jgi:hypothetical protein
MNMTERLGFQPLCAQAGAAMPAASISAIATARATDFPLRKLVSIVHIMIDRMMTV